MVDDLNQETLDKICVYAKFVKSGDDRRVRDDSIHCKNNKGNKQFDKYYCVASSVFNSGDSSYPKYTVYINLDKINSCKYCSTK